jgi:hypothetical protein
MKLPSTCEEQRPDYDSSSSRSLESVSEPIPSSDTDNDSVPDGSVGYQYIHSIHSSVYPGSNNTTLAMLTHTENVLDRMMTSPVQSYQQLLESFTYFTSGMYDWVRFIIGLCLLYPKLVICCSLNRLILTSERSQMIIP